MKTPASMPKLCVFDALDDQRDDQCEEAEVGGVCDFHRTSQRLARAWADSGGVVLLLGGRLVGICTWVLHAAAFRPTHERALFGGVDGALGDAELMRLRQRYFAIDPGASAFGCAASQRPGCETCHLTSGDDAMVCLQCGARRHLLLRLVLHSAGFRG